MELRELQAALREVESTAPCSSSHGIYDRHQEGSHTITNSVKQRPNLQQQHQQSHCHHHESRSYSGNECEASTSKAVISALRALQDRIAELDEDKVQLNAQLSVNQSTARQQHEKLMRQINEERAQHRMMIANQDTKIEALIAQEQLKAKLKPILHSVRGSMQQISMQIDKDSRHANRLVIKPDYIHKAAL